MQSLGIENHGTEWTTVEFDFLIEGESLRLPLLQHLQAKDMNNTTTISIEYLEKYFFISQSHFLETINAFKPFLNILNN